MSPFCPECLAPVTDGSLRCPLDQRFLHRRLCRECDAELYPRERYCCFCGSRQDDPEEELLLPASAALSRQAGAITLDALSLVLILSLVLSQFPIWLLLPALPLGFLLYRTAGRSGGRQTLGQAVFHTLTVSPEAAGATAEQALRRSLGELFLLPRLLLQPKPALEQLERWSESFEIGLV